MNKKELFYTQRNFCGIPPEYSTFANSPVVVLPVPYDGTTEWQIGARKGPQAIIDASQNLELYDFELGVEIHKVGICTLPEVEPVMAGPEPMIARVKEIATELVDKGKFIVTLGGEHSLTLGVIQAMAKKYPRLTVLQLDAHGDLNDQYLGTRFSYASAMRRVSELCPVVPIGIRNLSLEEHQYLKRKKIEPFYARGLAIDEVFWKKLLSSLPAEVYITIDLDVFDPAIMPAVTAPEPGGLNWLQVLAILERVIGEKRVVGFDLMELCPQEGSANSAYLAAALAYKLIGYVSTSPKSALTK